mgnify:FL=1
MKNKLISMALAVIGIVVIVASLYVAISYLSYIGKVLIDFFSANNVQEMSACGVQIPEDFIEIRNQIPSTILPAVYLGIPVVLILISLLMFFSGYFFGKYKVGTEIDAHLRREEEIEEAVKKRTEGKKGKSGSAPKHGEKSKKAKEEEED